MHHLLLDISFSFTNSSTSSAVVWSASVSCKLMSEGGQHETFVPRLTNVINRSKKKKKIARNKFLDLLKSPAACCLSQQVVQAQLGYRVCKWLWQGTDLAGHWNTTDGVWSRFLRDPKVRAACFMLLHILALVVAQSKDRNKQEQGAAVPAQRRTPVCQCRCPRTPRARPGPTGRAGRWGPAAAPPS